MSSEPPHFTRPRRDDGPLAIRLPVSPVPPPVDDARRSVDADGAPRLAAPRLEGALLFAAGVDRLDPEWWATNIEARASTLRQYFAVDLLTLALSEHGIALTMVSRSDRTLGWSEAEVFRRWGRLRAARNLFCHATSPVLTAGLSPQCSSEEARFAALRKRDPQTWRLREALADPRRYRRELLGWVARKRVLVRPPVWQPARPLVQPALGAKVSLGRERLSAEVILASDCAVGNPALVAAITLVGIECATLRARWLASLDASPLTGGGRSDQSRNGTGAAMTFADLDTKERLRGLAAEFGTARTTSRESRPVTQSIRRLIGDERFDQVQRLAVDAVARWEKQHGSHAPP
jgi:hypothetical protein